MGRIPYFRPVDLENTAAESKTYQGKINSTSDKKAPAPRAVWNIILSCNEGKGLHAHREKVRDTQQSPNLEEGQEKGYAAEKKERRANHVSHTRIDCCPQLLEQKRRTR